MNRCTLFFNLQNSKQNAKDLDEIKIFHWHSMIFLQLNLSHHAPKHLFMAYHPGFCFTLHPSLISHDSLSSFSTSFYFLSDCHFLSDSS